MIDYPVVVGCAVVEDVDSINHSQHHAHFHHLLYATSFAVPTHPKRWDIWWGIYAYLLITLPPSLSVDCVFFRNKRRTLALVNQQRQLNPTAPPRDFELSEECRISTRNSTTSVQLNF